MAINYDLVFDVSPEQIQSLVDTLLDMLVGLELRHINVPVCRV